MPTHRTADLSSHFEPCSKNVEYAVRAGVILTNPDMLKLYSYFKQGTVGDCNTPKPNGVFNFKEKAKWDAWNDLKGLGQKDAQAAYVKTSIDLDIYSV